MESALRPYNRRSFWYGVPGFILLVAGTCVLEATVEPNAIPGPLVAWSCITAGSALLIAGLCYNARVERAKGPWQILAWVFMDVLMSTVVGLLVLPLWHLFFGPASETQAKNM